MNGVVETFPQRIVSVDPNFPRQLSSVFAPPRFSEDSVASTPYRSIPRLNGAAPWGYGREGHHIHIALDVIGAEPASDRSSACCGYLSLPAVYKKESPDVLVKKPGVSVGFGKLATASVYVCTDRRCMELQTDAKRANATGGTTSPMSRRGGSRVKDRIGRSVAAALVVLVAVFVAGAFLRIDFSRRVSSFLIARDLHALADAVGQRRVISARLTGGFQFGPVDAPTRAVSDPTSVDYPLVVVAAGIVRKTTGDGRPAARHAAGIAWLVLRDHDRAISALEDAVGQEPSNADYESDLAAAWLARSAQGGSRTDLLRALNAIDMALAVQPDLAEALYNRPMVLDALGLVEAADTARHVFLVRDGMSPWAREVHDRVGSLADDRSCLTGELADDSSGTADALDRFVTTCPARAREQVEWEDLPAWADAIEHDPKRGKAALARAGRIADAIARIHGDQMPLTGTRAIEQAVSRATRELLASGHRELALGQRLYDTDHRDGAIEHLERASKALHRATSPYWLWAEQYLARIDSHRRQSSDALARLDVIRAHGVAGAFTSLLAREAWLRGLVSFQAANPSAAIENYYTAVAYYEALGEVENAANVFNTLADTQRIVGDLDAGWEVLSRALARIADVRDPTRRYLICYNASLYCLRFGLDRAALVFQDEAVRHARSRAGAAGVIEALLNRSKIQEELSHSEQSRRDRDDALSLMSTITDDQQRRYMLARHQAIEAEMQATLQPSLAIASAQRALAYFSVAEPGEVPRLRGVVARAARRLGDREQAMRELRMGIDAFKQRRLQLSDEVARAAYFDEGWPLYAELVDLLLALDRWQEAFEVAEESKAMALADRMLASTTLPTSTMALRALLPPGVSVVALAQHGDRLHWWRLDGRDLSHGAVPMSASELTRLVARTRDLLTGNTPAAASEIDHALTQLYRLLIEPLKLGAVRSLIWIPDGPVQDIPVAALKNPQTGRYVVEDVDVAVAPSVRVFVAASRRLVRRVSTQALIIGDPAFNRDLFRHVPPLRGARQEAEEVARLYPHAITLVGSLATRGRVLDALRTVDIVHLAGHAIGNNTAPQMSELLLAPDPGVDSVGALYGYELASLPVAARIVVLAACQTASGRMRPGEGPLSLARTLLGSGVGAVVGTLWDVDDEASRSLGVAFHEHLRDLHDPAAALCAAQRRLLHTRAVQQWAGFQVYGGVVTHDDQPN